MKMWMKSATATIALVAATQANATNFFFSSGNYSPGVTAPEPLQSPDTLELDTGNNKFFNAVTFTNQSGIANWSAGNLFFSNGAQIVNQSLWNMTSDNSLNNNGGAASAFNNSGIFRKSGGLGSSAINSIAFLSNGTIDAQTGSIDFNSGAATFNAGSSFTGAGDVNINSNAAFNGALTSSNLNFQGGTFTGGSAALTGSADWIAGTFTGDWAVTAGSTVNAQSGNNKFLNSSTFTNDGTVNWTAGNLFLSNGSQLINNDLIDFTATQSLNNNGGALSTVTNGAAGELHVASGQTVTFNNTFVNNGSLLTAGGTFAFNNGSATFNNGTTFTGAGTNAINNNAAFNGTMNTSNLDFNGGTFTGTGAVLNGSADWAAGTFTGDWNLNAGSTLNAQTGNNKFLNSAAFTNDGTVNWGAGNLFLSNNSQLTNNDLVEFTSTQSLNNNGGALSTITNSATGLLHVTTGNTVTFNNTFVNDGSMLTADGTFAFNNGTATFNNGTTFNGTGTNAINNNATFNGTMNTNNLDFNGGTFTGSSAVLNGSADWAAGTFTGDWNLNAGSTLNAQTGNNKFLNAANFTNDGTVNWTAGNLFLSNGSQLANNALIDITSTQSINNNGGAVSTLTNNAAGTVHVSGGNSFGVNNTLVNNGGTLTADGVINYNNGTATFNTGTTFNGAGTNAINNNASFNGAINSTNLEFNGGTFSGGNAVLNGSADWVAGTFTGIWDLAAGSTLDLLSGNNKLLNAATVTIDGAVNWAAGNLFLSNGSQVVNDGTIKALSDNSINNNGGAASSLVNNGLIEKTAGTGTTTLASGISLDNNGTINVLSGTIALPNGFANDGTLGGTGIFSSSTLTNNGTVAPGAPGTTGTLSLTGSFIQGALGTMNSQLASTALSDLFNISGSASLNGTLALSCIFGCAINDGDSFILLDSVGALTGSYSNITTSGFLNGFSYNVFYDYTSNFVRLDVIDAGMAPPPAVPEPSSWALMILGFGLVGTAMRRRSKARGLSFA
jgi:hypothetical protein